MRDATLEELMTAYAEGDEGAFRLLHSQPAPRLHGFFRASGFSMEVSKDLVQQTFLRVHLASDRYRRGAPVRPWVFRIATNLFIDERRKRGAAREQSFGEGEEERLVAPEPHQEDLEARADSVRCALDALPQSQREVIILHKYEGMSLQDVATAVGCTVGAAKLRAFRGYEALRRILVGGDA